MSLGDVVDKLHDEHRLSHTGTTEESDLTTLHVGLQQVDYLDTSSENLFLSREFLERRCVAVDGISPLHVELFHTIDRLTDHVQHTTFNLITGRHHDG